MSVSPAPAVEKFLVLVELRFHAELAVVAELAAEAIVAAQEREQELA